MYMYVLYTSFACVYLMYRMPAVEEEDALDVHPQLLLNHRHHVVLDVTLPARKLYIYIYIYIYIYTYT